MSKAVSKEQAYIGKDNHGGMWLVVQEGAGSAFHYVMSSSTVPPAYVMDSIKSMTDT